MLIQGHLNPHHLPVTWRARPTFYRHLGIPYMLLQPITHLLQTGPRFDSAPRTQTLSQTRTEPVTTSAQRQLIYGPGYRLEMTRRFIMCDHVKCTGRGGNIILKPLYVLTR